MQSSDGINLPMKSNVTNKIHLVVKTNLIWMIDLVTFRLANSLKAANLTQLIALMMLRLARRNVMSMINVDSSDGDQMKIDVTDIIPWIVRVTMQMQLLDTNTVEVSNIKESSHNFDIQDV